MGKWRTYIFTLIIPGLLGYWWFVGGRPKTSSLQFCGVSDPPSNYHVIQDSTYWKGKQLYEENCATCHKIKGEMTGPELYEVEYRVPGGREAIYEFVRKPDSLVQSSSYFKALYEKYNKTAMTSSPNLKDEEIDQILDYVDSQ